MNSAEAHRGRKAAAEHHLAAAKENIPNLSSNDSRRGSPTPLGSVSRHPKANATPRLLHAISHDRHSILSLVCDQSHIYSGQGNYINVWDISSLLLKKSLAGHQGSILDMKVDPEHSRLFSSSSHSTVRIWDTVSLRCVYQIDSAFDVGDLFSLAYSSRMDMIYTGCQNTAIQWFNLKNVQQEARANDSEDRPPLPHRYSKFFDGKDRNDTHEHSQGSPTISSEGEGDLVLTTADSRIEFYKQEQELQQYDIPVADVIKHAHHGYVYCLVIGSLHGRDEDVLFSASGDGTVKLWSTANKRPKLLHTLSGADGGVLTIVIKDGLLFAGAQDGDIRVWDLDTFQLVRSIIAHDDDVLAMSIRDQNLYSCSADGMIKKWSTKYDCVGTWKGHDGIILSSIIAKTSTQHWLITGAGDNLIKIWDISHDVLDAKTDTPISFGSDFFYSLGKLIALRTVSGNPRDTEDCRLAAKFLQSVLRQLGATSNIITNDHGGNPIVHGIFTGRDTGKPRRRVLVYGHYDVISADEKTWDSPPYQLEGRNGYLYARGVTDNKGPMLTLIWAVSELLHEQSLDVDVVFLIEGEEESGSKGFFDAVHKHREAIGKVDVILVCNSYWLDDETPCLTYGLRGVIHATIRVKSDKADLHSGVEGGAISEPLIDLVKVLSKLTDEKCRVRVSGFYDSVRPVQESESKLYDPIEKAFGSDTNKTRHLRTSEDMTLKDSLMAKWRYPWLSVHKVNVSGPNNSTVIPSSAEAKLSVRIVPDQDLSAIAKDLTTYIEEAFAMEKTSNKIEVKIDHVADWWLGEVESKYFECAQAAIRKEWGVQPLYIREGGSITPLRWLEKEYQCTAINLPLGQASDGAHLNNERIRLQNLQAGRRIVKDFLKGISTL